MDGSPLGREGMRKLVAVVALVLVSTVAVAQQKTPPSQDDLPAAPIKDADLFQVTAHQDGAATDYIYSLPRVP